MDTIEILELAFDPAVEISRLTRADKSMGAMVSFIGTMRDINEGDAVSAMTLEHYPGMTEKALGQIVADARQQWDLGDVTVMHRVGRVEPADPIVLVAVTSKHRGESFDACEYIIDFLKTRAPFWKKELTDKGERWVDAKALDDETASLWEDDGF
jgi:molybdopterin synthase catalytic subunit